MGIAALNPSYELALPGLVVAIYPERDNQAVATYAVELTRHAQAMRRVGNMVQQAHADDAADSVRRHIYSECRGLKALHLFEEGRGLRGSGDCQHVGRVVRCEDGPVRLFGQ